MSSTDRFVWHPGDVIFTTKIGKPVDAPVHPKHAKLLAHADVREPQMHEAFKKAVHHLRRNHVDVAALRVALRRRDVEGAMATLPSYFDVHAAMTTHLKPLVKEHVEQGRRTGAEHRGVR